MSNDFFSATGAPATRAAGASSPIRSQFAAIEGAFDKMPTLTGNSGLPVRVNIAETALEAHTPYGSYTPVATVGTNCDAATPVLAYWFQMGTIVTVFGRVSVDPTANGTRTIFTMTLPVASNFSSNAQLGGTFAGQNTGLTNAGVVIGEPTLDEAQFIIESQSSSAVLYQYHYSYVVV